jgi:hypothetical protein
MQQQEEKEQEKAEFARKVNDSLMIIKKLIKIQVITELFGDDCHLHIVSEDEEYFQKLTTIEAQNHQPISMTDPAFMECGTEWIYEPGLHIGWDNEKEEIVFAVRIRLEKFLQNISSPKLTSNL